MSFAKKKVIISACLLGEYCRYDGKTKEYESLLKYYEEWEIIPFCPEAPIFGTPRERINVVEINGEKKIFTDKTNKDVTKLLSDEINNFVEQNRDIDEIVLKSKSPSCGYKTTPILNSKKEILRYENGIAADILQKYYEGIKIKDELNFSEF